MEILSDFLIFPNQEGRKIAACWDRSASVAEDAPFVLITPKYGETKKNNLQLAYTLTANGLQVLRFDHTLHTGESDGPILEYTFSSGTRDILDCVTFLGYRFGIREVILVANSLSVRPALRAARLDPRIARVVSVVGVVNFRETARNVYQDDMVARHLAGELLPITDILGHRVLVSRFLEDCIQQNMHDLSGTMEDVRKANSDFFFFCAENDAWVRSDDMRELSGCRENLSIRWIPDAMHEIRENPNAAGRMLKETVFACRYGRFPDARDLDAIAPHPKAQTLARNRIERERLKKANPLKEKEAAFWREYLQKFSVLESVGDYQEYMELVAECLGPIRERDILFDIGCGNGLYGAWLLQHLRGTHPSSSTRDRPVYLGLDLTARGLGEAVVRHAKACSFISQSDSLPGMPESLPPLDFHYLVYNLDSVGRTSRGASIPLPFADGSVDKICCSLLISYLRRPSALLRECHRILRPGGRIVVSSMKPHCDLSVLYRDFVQENPDPEILQSARNLLSAAGAIRTKEEHGYYMFYTRHELVDLLGNAGFEGLQAYRSFGNQANLAVGTR